MKKDDYPFKAGLRETEKPSRISKKPSLRAIARRYLEVQRLRERLSLALEAEDAR